MNKPKIAIISYFFSESTVMLSKYLGNSACVDLYLITTRFDSESPGFDYRNEKRYLGLVKVKNSKINEFIDNNDVSLFLIRLTRHTKRRIFLFLNWIIALYVILRINSKRYDYIDIVGQNPLLITFHKLLSCKKKVHTIHEFIDHLEKKNLDNRLIDYLSKKNIKVIVHSEKSRNDAINFTPIKDENIVKINFGLFESYKLFKPVDIIKEENYILFYGLLRPYKGLDILYDAITILRHQNKQYTFVIAGRGDISNKEAFERLESVKIINRNLTNAEIVGLNVHAKAIVCPYRSASQSGILMTSYLFGKPIIATDVGAFGEVIRNGKNGILIRPENAEELAFAIDKIYSDSDLYGEMVFNISKFGHNDMFNWNAIANDTMKLYDKL